MAIPDDSVDVQFGEGFASMGVSGVSVLDYHDLLNALFGGGPAPVPATLSFNVRWFGVEERVQIVNRPQGFRGTFIRNSAQMEWSATVGDFTFVSSPLHTSSSVFSELGQERNGSFFSNP